MLGRGQSRFRNLPFGLLLGCALLLRALVPAGWMPAAGQGFGLEICADGFDGAAADRFARAARQAFDEAVAGSPASRHRGDDADRAGKDQPCAFAGLALPWTGTQAPSLPEPAAFAAYAPARAAPASVGRGLAAPPPPATGPPAFS